MFQLIPSSFKTTFCFTFFFLHHRSKESIQQAQSSCERKETVDIDILGTSRNGDRKIIKSIRITSTTPLRIKKCAKVIPIQIT